jgi:hypothetical protein
MIRDLAQRYRKRGRQHREVQSLTFKGENRRSDTWLCLQMALLKTLFCEKDFL